MSIPRTFIDWVQTEVRAFRSRYPTISTDRHAFAGWALSFIHEIEEDDAFNQTETLEIGDGGCDGSHFSGEEDKFYILQAKFPDDPLGAPVGNGPLQELQHAYAALLNPERLDGRSRKLVAIGQELCEAIAGGSQVVLQCIVFGRLSDPAFAELRAAEPSLPNGATFELVDLEVLYRIHLARETEDDLAGKTIKFRLFNREAIPLQAPIHLVGIRKALTCNLDAKDLAKNVNEQSPSIFSKNVRFHLGHRNAVNKKVRALLQDDAERPAFWYYNNGLTILCDDFEYLPATSEVAITNPQIVNGCQSATALADKRSFFRQADQAFPVGAKVICVSNDAAGQEKQLKIAENTNSQSPVKAADLKSNQRNQAQIQRSFADLRPNPWFYERKRGEWSSLDDSEQARYGDRRISMITIGQRWRAFAGEPAASISNKDDMFTTAIYGDVYNPLRHPNLFLLSHFLHEEFGRFLSAEGEPRRRALAGAEFDSRYLNRVLRGKNLAVAHLVCMARALLESIYGEIDYVKAGALVDVLQTAPEGCNDLWKQIIAAFKNWADALGESTDLRNALKRSEALPQLKLKLDDHILALPGWSHYRLPLPLPRQAGL
jgi:hypothetical protein